MGLRIGQLAEAIPVMSTLSENPQILLAETTWLRRLATDTAAVDDLVQETWLASRAARRARRAA